HAVRMARRAGADLVHSLASTGPAGGRFARVVTVHDLHYRVHPEAHFGMRALGMRALVPLAARRAHRVIVPSEARRAAVATGRPGGSDSARGTAEWSSASPPSGRTRTSRG